MLYEINKKAEATVDTTVGQTESINMKEIVKPGSIFGPIMCWATTSKVNKIGEVQYSYRKIDIGMSVYINDIPLLRNNNKQGRKPRRTYKR